MQVTLREPQPPKSVETHEDAHDGSPVTLYLGQQIDIKATGIARARSGKGKP